MNDKYISIILIVIAIGISMFLSGCGKKGPPVPPRQEAPPAVYDLASVLEGDRVILTWTAPVVKEKKGPLITGFVVHKAKNQIQESGCKNCPVKYEAVAEIAAGHEGESKKMEYTGQLEKGYKYYFKVTAFGEKINALGMDSNIVEFIY